LQFIFSEGYQQILSDHFGITNSNSSHWSVNPRFRDTFWSDASAAEAMQSR